MFYGSRVLLFRLCGSKSGRSMSNSLVAGKKNNQNPTVSDIEVRIAEREGSLQIAEETLKTSTLS